MADNAFTKLSLGGQLGVSVAARGARRRALLVPLLVGRRRRSATRRRPSSRPCSKEIRALEVTAQQAAGVPARGRAAGSQARDPEAHPAPGQGDAGPDAQGPGPGRAVEPDHQELHARRHGEQGVLPGVADQRWAWSGQLPQPRPLLRPGRAAPAPRQRRQHQDHGDGRRRRSSQTITRRLRGDDLRLHREPPPPPGARQARRGRDEERSHEGLRLGASAALLAGGHDGRRPGAGARRPRSVALADSRRTS